MCVCVCVVHGVCGGEAGQSYNAETVTGSARTTFSLYETQAELGVVSVCTTAREKNGGRAFRSFETPRRDVDSAGQHAAMMLVPSHHRRACSVIGRAPSGGIRSQVDASRHCNV